MIGKWGFSLLPFYLGIIPIFANNNYTLTIETISMFRLDGWENEICHTLKEKQILSQASKDFIKSPSYGDGGMAAAVRIVSNHQ